LKIGLDQLLFNTLFKYNFPRFKDKGEILGVEFELVKKDGSIILVHFNGKIAYDNDGNFVQTHCIFYDITEQRKSEDLVRKSKEEWENTFNAMEDIVTIQDKEMRIVRANKTAYDTFHAEPGELEGKYCYEVFKKSSQPCSNCPELVTLKDKKAHTSNIAYEDLGKIFHITSAPVLNEHGEFTHIVHIAKDITEHKQMEAELFRAQKMEAVGVLAGGVAHDFNNILSAIIGFSELAKIHIPHESEANKDIDKVLKAGHRATDLVKQILTFGRKTEQLLQPLAPYLVIKEALKMLRSTLPATITIQEEIDSECGSILADPTNIHQIVVNLCTNAFHAMENEKGLLSVKLCRKEMRVEDLIEPEISPGPFIVLSISDTGPGMDQKIISRIFEPYFTTKEVGEGTGLGLAVIYGIVKAYSGFIRVESEPDKGTSFHLYFPALERNILLQEKEEGSFPLPLGTERILIVDDEPLIVQINKRKLETLGYTVTATSDSHEALEKFRLNPDQFDLLITDQTMPKLTGAELASRILEIKPSMPIIMCTGHSGLVSEKDALAIGIQKYVFKPLHGNELAIAARELLNEKKEV